MFSLSEGAILTTASHSQVVPSEFGTTKHPLFCVMPRYMCPGRRRQIPAERQLLHVRPLLPRYSTVNCHFSFGIFAGVQRPRGGPHRALSQRCRPRSTDQGYQEGLQDKQHNESGCGSAEL